MQSRSLSDANGSAGEAGRAAQVRYRLISTATRPSRAECGENRGGEHELQACRERTRAVPAVVVEELPSARAQERQDVLEVGRGARRSAECCRIERASPCGEQEHARDPAADLEPTRLEVSVREAVAGEVEERP
jgi:hypothetical protein